MQIETMVRELWDREHIAKVPRAYSRGVDRRVHTLARNEPQLDDDIRQEAGVPAPGSRSRDAVPPLGAHAVAQRNRG